MGGAASADRTREEAGLGEEGRWGRGGYGALPWEEGRAGKRMQLAWVRVRQVSSQELDTCPLTNHRKTHGSQKDRAGQVRGLITVLVAHIRALSSSAHVSCRQCGAVNTPRRVACLPHDRLSD